MNKIYQQFEIHTNSAAATPINLYVASADDLEIVGCFFDNQEIIEDTKKYKIQM